MAGCLPELAESRIGKAIHADSCELLLKCLRQHDNIFLTDKRNNNFLHYACTMHRPKVLHLLLTTELDIDAQNRSGNTPLHVTAVCNQSCMVPILLMYGADPNISNNENKKASDIKTNNGTWRAAYDIYQPGVFAAVERGDGEALLDLIRKWCKTDVSKEGRTLRQWAAVRGHHHLLRLMDKHKYTLECIYGVLEQNYDKFEKAAKKNGCNVNWLNKGCGLRHVVEYALSWGLEDMVSVLCDRGANLNMITTYKQYIKAPLYFSVIGNRSVSFSLLKTVLNTDLDIHAKDERGRNAVMFAVDRAPAARVPYIVDHFLSRGLSIADRDDTGATLRNLALLNDNTEIRETIDKMIIRLIRNSNTDAMWRLAEDGYDDFFFEYLWKDSFIYAAGNDTDHVTRFLHSMQDFPKHVDRLNHILSRNPHNGADDGDTGNRNNRTGNGNGVSGNGHNGSDGSGSRLDLLREFLEESEFREHLLTIKDRAGRTPLTRAVMLACVETVQYLLSQPACTTALNQRTDNLYRTSLHYAYCMRDQTSHGEAVLQCLLDAGADTTLRDACGLLPEDFSSGKPKQKLLDEMSRMYGMMLEMHLLKKYKEMRKIISSQNKTDHSKYKKFLRISRNLWYPLSALPKTLNPNGIPLVKHYRDLLFIAIDHRHQDIAKKLVYLGSDCQRREWIPIDVDGRKVQTLMTPAEYAAHQGLSSLADYIHQRQLSAPARTTLFHRALTSVNDARVPGFLLETRQQQLIQQQELEREQLRLQQLEEEEQLREKQLREARGRSSNVKFVNF